MLCKNRDSNLCMCIDNISFWMERKSSTEWKETAQLLVVGSALPTTQSLMSALCFACKRWDFDTYLPPNSAAKIWVGAVKHNSKLRTAMAYSSSGGWGSHHAFFNTKSLLPGCIIMFLCPAALFGCLLEALLCLIHGFARAPMETGTWIDCHPAFLSP